MPFVALAPLLGGLAAAGGSIGAGALAGRKSSDEKQIYSQLLKNMQAASGLSGNLTGMGTNWLNQASSLFGPTADYYKMRMQRPDARQIRAELVPQQQQMVDQYNQAFRGAQTQAPRSGAGAAFMSQMPFTQARSLQELINQQLQRKYQMQGEGAAGLTNLTGMAAGTGQGLMGTAMQGYGQATGAANSMFSQEQARNAQQMAAGQGWSQMMMYFFPQIMQAFGAKTAATSMAPSTAAAPATIPQNLFGSWNANSLGGLFPAVGMPNVRGW